MTDSAVTYIVLVLVCYLVAIGAVLCVLGIFT